METAQAADGGDGRSRRRRDRTARARLRRRTPTRRRPGARRSAAAVSLLDRALDLAAGIALGDRASLVDPLLAPRQPQLELHLAVREVERERHQRHPTLCDLGAKL